MKYLDNTGLSHLVAKIKSQTGKLSVTDYRYVTTSEGAFSLTIPSFNSDMYVELYINGLRCIQGFDYTLSDGGTITTLKSIDKDAEMFISVKQIVEG